MKRHRIVFLLALLALSACGSNPPKRDPEYAPVTPVPLAPQPEGNGAIYQSGYGMAWFEDLRAKRVGDLLTVKLVEKTTGTKKSSTAVDKSNSNSVSNPTVFGVSPEVKAPPIPGIPSGSTMSLASDTSSTHAFEGTSDSSQSNNLSGEVTVTVVEVLPYGNMRVRGEKRIGINEGNEYVKISGIVRPQDIDTSNTVLSTKLGDPTIVYVGDGATGDANKVGWLSRFFIGALMPF